MTIMEIAEEIERLTEGRIPFDRATWIALYIERVTGGMSHEEAIRLEADEHRARRQPLPSDPIERMYAEAFEEDGGI